MRCENEIRDDFKERMQTYLDNRDYERYDQLYTAMQTHSLGEKSERKENRVLYTLLHRGVNEWNKEYYADRLTYHWYNCKKSLLSGIDIYKWL